MSHEIQNFEADVIERSRHTPVLVDFWAAWCGPCRALGPVLEKLERDAHGAWVLAKVDVDNQDNRAAAATYGVQGIPAVKLFMDGAVVAEFTGALPEAQVARWLEANLPGAEKERLGEAIALLQAGRVEQAKTALRALLGDESLAAQARILLAQVILFEEPAEARALVAGVGADSDYADAAGDVTVLAELLERDPAELPERSARPSYLAALEALHAQAFESALEHFIEVLGRDKQYDGGGARKGCIAIFNYLGREHPLSKRFRRSFQSALN